MKLSTKGIDTTKVTHSKIQYFNIPYQHVSRHISTLLELVLTTFINMPRPIGICSALAELHFADTISHTETDLIYNFLNTNKPNKHSIFWYKPYHKAWRIKWLEKHIKLTKQSC